MAVQNSQAPGGKDQQSSAGEKYPHQGDRQLALGAMKAVRNYVDQQRRGEDAKQYQRGGE